VKFISSNLHYTRNRIKIDTSMPH